MKLTFSCQDSGGLHPPTGQLPATPTTTATPSGRRTGSAESSTRATRYSIRNLYRQESAPWGQRADLPRPVRPHVFGALRLSVPTRETTTSPLCRFEVICQARRGTAQPGDLGMGQEWKLSKTFDTHDVSNGGTEASSTCMPATATIASARAHQRSSGPHIQWVTVGAFVRQLGRL
jgi:hypothetical protein